MTTALFVIALCLVVFALACMFAAVVYGAYKIYQSLKGVSDKLEMLNDQLSGVPIILSGVKKICEELASYTVNVSGSVDKLRNTLFDGKSDARRGAKDSDHFQPYTDDNAMLEYKIMEAVREHNVSYSAARDMVVAGLDESRFVVGED